MINAATGVPARNSDQVIERNYIKKNYRKFVERKFKETLENSLLCRLGVGELDKKKKEIPILAFRITEKMK